MAAMSQVEYEQRVRELAALVSQRDETNAEMEETASPDVVRELRSLAQAGATQAELRAAFLDLDEREKRELSSQISMEERTELINAAEAAAEDPSKRAEYRRIYCRIRDDAKLRRRLAGMDESRAQAWREADALEKQGMTPQEVADELRRRIGDDCKALDDMVRDPKTAGERYPELVRVKKDVRGPPLKLKRGFLLEDPKTVVAKRLGGISNVEEACAAAARNYARVKEPIADLAYVLDAAATAATAQKIEDVATAFADAVLRLSLVPPYEGPRLSVEIADFMVDIHERRRRHEDDVTLRQSVLEHIQRHGPAFLEHMAACAHLIDALLDVDCGGDVKRQIRAHYT